jgi:hypothetical protein
MEDIGGGLTLALDSAEDTVSVPASCATYVGSFETTADGRTDDTMRKRFLYNQYNQAIRPIKVEETTASWVYSAASYQQARASTANKVAVLRGFDSQPAHAEVIGTVASSGATPRSVRVGIGIGSSTVNSGRAGVNSASGTINAVPSAVYDG